MAQVPKEFAEDFALFAADRVACHGWSDEDVADCRVFLRELFEAGHGQLVMDDMTGAVREIRERHQMVRDMVARIKRRIADQAAR